MWILTEEFAEYDQHGEYFRAAWLEKPSEEVLLAFFLKYDLEGLNTFYKEKEKKEKYLALVKHLMTGGGRVGVEYSWYYLTEYEAGTY